MRWASEACLGKAWYAEACDESAVSGFRPDLVDPAKAKWTLQRERAGEGVLSNSQVLRGSG